MTTYLPAGCKAAKINLSGAYRTTLTRLIVGDVVRLDRRQTEVNGALIPTPTHSPARSFWATITEITRSGGQIHITTDKGQMPGDFAHTSITRKERATETTERLELDARAREDAVRASEEARLEKALADHPTPAAPVVPAIPFMCGSHAHRTQAERTECQVATKLAADLEQVSQARLVADGVTVAAMPLAEPADLAADLVRIGRDGNIPEPITHAMNVVGQLLDAASDADRAYYRLVYAELTSLRDRAVRVAADAAMRQDKRERELAAIYGAESVHDFEGGYSGMSCVRMVMRPDGTADACGEPVKSAIHDPQAYAAYRAELTRELAKLRTGSPVELDVDSAFPAVASPDRTKLLNAEGTVRNLLASAKQAQARYAGRGDEPDQHAWERARARVRALEEVLELLV